MKLWLISQDENRDYDTYDSAVVAAENEEDARATHPSGDGWKKEEIDATWATSPGAVTVEYISDAAPGTEAGVICASFNAG